nr:response regulator transcription factor [Gammaproteobacteria bacterium]NIR93591.1 response regulator transcription factor [Gammaproteobacteria bacterium]NIW45013.1 response regulator [Gammaproteobacteria bacterium]NIX56242.1 response regulator [candidate division Zixibacteria bacterium]
MSETNNIRVLLVDDHPVIRDGYSRLLDNTSDIKVIGEAESGEEAYQMYLDLQPDVMVLDINMPGNGG